MISGPDELPLYELLARLQSDAACDPAGTLAAADAALDRYGPSAWLYAVIGRCELALGDTDAARDAAKEAIALLPNDAALALYAAPVLLAAGAVHEAVAALEQVMRQEPDSDDIRQLLVQARSMKPDNYKIDPEPVNDITPAILAGMLEGVVQVGACSIGDAGCGVGAMATHLRSYASRLVGVDLSPQRLVVARQTGLYDELVASEPVTFLIEENTVYDLIVAANVLNYIGPLEGFFTASAHSLNPGGWLLLAAQKASASSSFQQLPTGRFAHSAGYLQQLCAAHGFRIEQMAEFQPRREGGNFIDGLAILARRD